MKLNITSSTQLVGAILKKYGGRITLSREDVEGAFEAFTTIEGENDVVILNRAFATAEDSVRLKEDQ